jgi:hypothetical protein
VKLFAENLFPKQKKIRSDSKLSQNINSELCKMNLRLEMAKFSSIFEAYESEQNSKFIVGYNLSSQQLFFSNVSKINPNSKFTPMNEINIKNSPMVYFYTLKRHCLKESAYLQKKFIGLTKNLLD